MAININKHFGEEVQKYRKKQKLSQLELAELAKVDLSTINRIERGIANVTLKRAFRITKALQVPMFQFFLTDKKTRKIYRKGEITDTPIDL